MLVRETYEFVTTHVQNIYIPEGIPVRNKQVGMWYAYLKWRLENIEGDVAGAMQSVEYVFPHVEYPFRFNSYGFKFLPDIEVKYNGIPFPEYHTLTNIVGNFGKMLRIVMREYPLITIRVIEPIEVKNMVKQLYQGGIAIRSLVKVPTTLETER